MAKAANLKEEGKRLGGILSAARKRPMRFAALVSKDGVVIEADARKSVSALVKAAKSAGGSPRGGWGVMRVDGKTVTLECESEPVGNFAKLVRSHFSERGHSVKVEASVRSEAGAEEEAKEAEAEAAAPDKKAAEKRDKTPKAKAADPEASEAPEPAEASGGKTKAKAAEERPPSSAAEAEVSADTDEDYPADPDDPDEAEDIAAQAGDLFALLKAARRKPYNFAWMIGGEGLVLKAHRRRPVKALIKQARAAGGGARGGWGVMRVEGSKILLTCAEPPVKGLARRARVWLHEQELKFRVRIQSPDETVLEADEAEDEAALVSAGEPGAGPTQDDFRAVFRDRIGAVDAAMRSADLGEGRVGRKLNLLFPLMDVAIEAGDFVRTGRILNLTRSTLAEADIAVEYDMAEGAGGGRSLRRTILPELAALETDLDTFLSDLQMVRA